MSAQVTISVTLVEGADPELPLPRYETEGAAGFDLRANLPAPDRAKGLILAPMARALVPTGLRVAVPAGYELQIRARSGLALNHGICLANGIGTVDSDYRGPLGVILINLGDAPFVIAHGARIAQGVLASVAQAQIVAVAQLSDTARGQGGFGSTGQG